MFCCRADRSHCSSSSSINSTDGAILPSGVTNDLSEEGDASKVSADVTVVKRTVKKYIVYMRQTIYAQCGVLLQLDIANCQEIVSKIERLSSSNSSNDDQGYHTIRDFEGKKMCHLSVAQFRSTLSF